MIIGIFLTRKINFLSLFGNNYIFHWYAHSEIFDNLHYVYSKNINECIISKQFGIGKKSVR